PTLFRSRPPPTRTHIGATALIEVSNAAGGLGWRPIRVFLGADPRGDGEAEGGAALVACGDPDPSAERALDHQPAEIQSQAKPALGAAAARRTGLLEHCVERASRQSLSVVGDRHLEPAALDLASLDLDGAARVLKCIADQVGEDLREVGRLAERGR